jgi:hypothetical protein
MIGFFWLLSEYWLILKKQYFSIFNPHPPAQWSQGTHGDVLLIPGWNESWYFLKIIGDALNKEGFKVFTVSALGNNTQSLKKSVQIITEYIDKIDSKDLILICHSKGGIIARVLLSNNKLAGRIKKVFFVSATVHGTLLGYFSVLGLKDQSLSSVKSLPMPTSQISKIINIYPLIDNHVIPNKNLILTGAVNIQLPVYGHTRILDSPQTVSEIVSHI